MFPANLLMAYCCADGHEAAGVATAAGSLVSAHAGELERMGLAPAWATLQVG